MRVDETKKLIEEAKAVLEKIEAELSRWGDTSSAQYSDKLDKDHRRKLFLDAVALMSEVINFESTHVKWSRTRPVIYHAGYMVTRGPVTATLKVTYYPDELEMVEQDKLKMEKEDA